MQSISLVSGESAKRCFDMSYTFILTLGAVYDNPLGLTFLLALGSASLFIFYHLGEYSSGILPLICILFITNEAEDLFVSCWPLGYSVL